MNGEKKEEAELEKPEVRAISSGKPAPQSDQLRRRAMGAIMRDKCLEIITNENTESTEELSRTLPKYFDDFPYHAFANIDNQLGLSSIIKARVAQSGFKRNRNKNVHSPEANARRQLTAPQRSGRSEKFGKKSPKKGNSRSTSKESKKSRSTTRSTSMRAEGRHTSPQRTPGKLSGRYTIRAGSTATTTSSSKEQEQDETRNDSNRSPLPHSSFALKPKNSRIKSGQPLLAVQVVGRKVKPNRVNPRMTLTNKKVQNDIDDEDTETLSLVKAGRRRARMTMVDDQSEARNSKDTMGGQGNRMTEDLNANKTCKKETHGRHALLRGRCSPRRARSVQPEDTVTKREKYFLAQRGRSTSPKKPPPSPVESFHSGENVLASSSLTCNLDQGLGIALINKSKSHSDIGNVNESPVCSEANWSRSETGIIIDSHDNLSSDEDIVIDPLISTEHSNENDPEYEEEGSTKDDNVGVTKTESDIFEREKAADIDTECTKEDPELIDDKCESEGLTTDSGAYWITVKKLSTPRDDEGMKCPPSAPGRTEYSEISDGEATKIAKESSTKPYYWNSKLSAVMKRPIATPDELTADESSDPFSPYLSAYKLSPIGSGNPTLSAPDTLSTSRSAPNSFLHKSNTSNQRYGTSQHFLFNFTGSDSLPANYFKRPLRSTLAKNAVEIQRASLEHIGVGNLKELSVKGKQLIQSTSCKRTDEIPCKKPPGVVRPVQSAPEQQQQHQQQDVTPFLADMEELQRHPILSLRKNGEMSLKEFQQFKERKGMFPMIYEHAKKAVEEHEKQQLNKRDTVFLARKKTAQKVAVDRVRESLLERQSLQYIQNAARRGRRVWPRQIVVLKGTGIPPPTFQEEGSTNEAGYVQSPASHTTITTLNSPRFGPGTTRMSFINTGSPGMHVRWGFSANERPQDIRRPVLKVFRQPLNDRESPRLERKATSDIKVAQNMTRNFRKAHSTRLAP